MEVSAKRQLAKLPIDKQLSVPVGPTEAEKRSWKKLLTEKQVVSDYIPWSVQQIRKLRSIGGGPEYIKLGRSVFYRESAILAWLAANTVNSTSEAK